MFSGPISSARKKQKGIQDIRSPAVHGPRLLQQEKIIKRLEYVDG